MHNAWEKVIERLTKAGFIEGEDFKTTKQFVDMMSYAMANSNTTTELLGEAYKNCAVNVRFYGLQRRGHNCCTYADDKCLH